MNDDRSLERVARSWIEEGPTRAPEHAVDGALRLIQTTQQERDLRIPRRFQAMPVPARAAVAAVIGVLAVGTIFALGRPTSNVGSSGVPATPTAVPSRSLSPSATAIDTATWQRYVSARYGFSIAHPPEVVERPADHDWTLEKDVDWQSTASEGFRFNPGPTLVTAWSVSIHPAELEDRALFNWVASYCSKITPHCGGLQDRQVPVTMDGHPGALATFNGDVQAFFLVGERVYVVAAWQPESYGSKELLKAYLSTMRLLPGGPAPASSSTSPRP